MIEVNLAKKSVRPSEAGPSWKINEKLFTRKTLKLTQTGRGFEILHYQQEICSALFTQNILFVNMMPL